MLRIINDLLWGPGTLALLLGSSVFLTVRMRFLPWRRLPFALRSALGREARQSQNGGVSPFSALMTTLAATIGTGNIVGVATALVAGGPGALVWMELSALFGMATIFSESHLAVKYRRRDRQGQWVGGPMYVMEHAFGYQTGRLIGTVFAIFAVAASFGLGGMTQANAISDALCGTFALPVEAVAMGIGVLSLAGILGGIRSISKITSVLVPAMTAFYLSSALAVIAGHWQNLLPGIISMLEGAFSPQAIAGGGAGAALRWGVARGVFSNEAGLGSTGIAAAAADRATPVGQGYINMTAAFFDTIIICTVTGLAICCSGVLGAVDRFGNPVDGATLTLLAFETVLGATGVRLLAIAIVLFAFCTILGWEYQGEQAFTYLTQGRGRLAYRIIYVLAAVWGAEQRLETVYLFSDICNALMCMPNLLCVLLMHAQVVREMRNFSKKHRKIP